MNNVNEELLREEEEGVEILADPSFASTRADAFLAEKTGMSRSAVARLMESGAILMNGGSVAKNYKLRGGEQFYLTPPENEPCEALPEDIPLSIVFEDEDIIVVNKPKGMVVHPAPGNTTGTLVNALLYHCRESLSGIGGVIRPGIVHRIDKDTEGLLVVAKNDRSHLSLAEQIKTHDARRIYYAIVHGNFREDEGTVDAPIGRHLTDRKRMAVIRDPARRAREAVTHWRVMERFGAFTLIRCELETGRTHQIRVHMSHLGHPLMGDEVYGGGGSRFEAKHRRLIDGQCLVACELCLTHPTTGEEMTFTVPKPEAFETLCEILRRECET